MQIRPKGSPFLLLDRIESPALSGHGEKEFLVVGCW